MDSFQNRDFSIPDGYAEEEIDGQLCLEDLDDDSELWLIRVPSDVHLSDLDKKKIYLGSNSNEINVKNIKTENGKLLECFAENCDIPSMCIVLPDRNGKKLQAVSKAFKGAILISEGLSLNDDTVKNEDDPPAITLDDTPNLSLESRKKNKKKKRRYSHNADNYDLNYETEDADNVSQRVEKHKHSKKRPGRNINYENEEIKSEPESTDVDGFPTCRSQTKVK